MEEESNLLLFPEPQVINLSKKHVLKCFSRKEDSDPNDNMNVSFQMETDERNIKMEKQDYWPISKSNSSSHPPDLALQISTSTDCQPLLFNSSDSFLLNSPDSRSAQSDEVAQKLGNETDKTFSCPFCQYRSLHSRFLAVHMRTHTGDKPYSCSFCDYRAAESSAMTKHVRIHTGEKPYPCPYCKYRTTESSNLNQHIKTHTGEKPFSCTLCKYRGSSSTVLTKHMRTHTGEKPFSCSYCDYKASTSFALNRHMKSHTGDKPSSYPYCEYRMVVPSGKMTL